MPGRSWGGNGENESWVTFGTPYPCNFSIQTWSSGTRVLPRKPPQTDLNASHTLSSFKLRSSSKSVSFSTSRIWVPIKMPSLSLAALRPGNTVDKCWKAAPFLCKAFTKFFIKPNLMWRGGRSTLFMSTRGFSLKLCLSGTKVLLDPQSFYL